MNPSPLKAPPEAWMPLLVGVAVAFCHVALRMTEAFPLGVFVDDGLYVALGRSLAEGEGFHSIYAPGSPPHGKYPPGLPWLFSLVWRAAPGLNEFKSVWAVISPLLTGFSACLIYVVGRRVMGLPLGLVLVLGLGPLLTDPAFHYLNLPLSEALYLLLWASFVLALGRCVKKEPEHSTWPWLAGALIVACLALMVRSQALALVLGGGIVLMVRRSVLVGGLFSFGALLPWAMWSRLNVKAAVLGAGFPQPDELGYTEWLTVGGIKTALDTVLGSLFSNARAYFWIMAENMAIWPWLGAAAVVGLMGLAIIGTLKRIGEVPEVVVPTVLTLGLLIAWPWPQDRFLLSALPFLGLLAAAGLSTVVPETLPFSWADKSTVLKATVLVLVALWVPRQFQVRQYAYDEFDPDAHLRVAYPSLFLPVNARYLTSTITWINHNATPEDRVVTTLHGGVFLYTGRKTITASPAQPTSGATVFDEPGAYLASRIIQDGATLAALGDARAPLAHDVQAISRACPGVIETAGYQPEPSPVVFYRFHRPTGSTACLLSFAEKIPAIWR